MPNQIMLSFLYLHVDFSPVQGGVNSDVDGGGGDPAVVVVDEQAVVGDLVPRCKPPYDHFARRNFSV